MNGRVDLFTTIHKGVRALLFDAALEAARVDLSHACAVDRLVERVERLLGFLDEHARHEDTEIIPIVQRYDPKLAATLTAEHISQDAVHHAVERAARALALAPDGDRRPAATALSRMLNQLVSLHLIHMNHEETVVNAVLWGALGDPDLVAIRERIVGGIPSERYSQWRDVLAPALDPAERALVIGGAVE